jgi:acylphosphatase
MRAVRIVVRGRVQGVGFRAWVVRLAHESNLQGWVRNLPDGDVEAEAMGEETALRRFVEAMRAGPVAARVEQAHEQWYDAPVPRVGFQVVG